MTGEFLSLYRTRCWKKKGVSEDDPRTGYMELCLLERSDQGVRKKKGTEYVELRVQKVRRCSIDSR